MRIRFRGYTIGSYNSGGDLGLISYHPKSSKTWHWSVTLCKDPENVKRPWVSRAPIREQQWFDYYWLPFGYELRVGYQDYHRVIE